MNVVDQALHNGVAPSEIAYVSFTKAASLEAVNRAMSAYPYLQRQDFPWFGTIHSICFRLLGLDRSMVFKVSDFAEASRHYEFSGGGDGVVLNQNIQEMALVTAADYFEHFVSWMAHTMAQDFDTAFRHYVAKAAWLPSEFTRQGLIEYTNRRSDYKAQNHLWDFSDMLLGALANRLAPTIKLLVLDEAQDNSPLLGAVVDMWAGGVENFHLAGDAFQSIYGWSGASPDILLDHEADEVLTLSQSHRCSRAVRDTAIKVLRRFHRHYEHDEFLPTEAPGVAVNVAQPVIEGQTFILARTRKQLAPYHDWLLEMHVPFRALRGAHSPLEKGPARALETILRLRASGVAASQELKMLAKYVPARPWFEVGGKEKLLSYEGTGLPLAHLTRWGMTDTFVKQVKGNDFAAPLKAPPEEKEYLSAVAHQHGLEAFEKPPPVTLGTVHSVKGQEADTVNLDLAMPRLPWRSYELNPDDEGRVFYVGITRARERLCLLKPASWRFFPL